MTFEAALREALRDLRVAATAAQIERLCAHFGLLCRWNRRVNLTAIRDPVAAARRHYGEAAFLHRELPATASAVDVGSGAGFPGVPFAVLRPGASVTLVESKQKKAAFLCESTREVANVTVAGCRIEDWSGRAEWALLRAVSPPSVLPRIAGRVPRAAVLGTDRPGRCGFGHWEGVPMPWGDRRNLWLGRALSASATGNVSRGTMARRQCST